MSFSSEVKAELCRATLSRKCCALAEAYGVLLYAGAFSASEVRIVTESADFAQRLPRLFHKAFSLPFDALPEEGSGKLIFRITQERKLESIFETLGYDARAHYALHVNFALVEEECCRAAFLRGAFLAGGSVTDPSKHYHLELVTAHSQVGREVSALLCDMGYEPRSVSRQGSSVAYFKQSEHIEELLTRIGAPACATRIMSAKVEKGLRNDINRRVNCDAANLDKAVDASRAQAAAIARLDEAGLLAKLPVKLQETAVARTLYPELTLSELAETFDPPLTKSCLNHRLRKLMELAGKASPTKEDSDQ